MPKLLLFLAILIASAADGRPQNPSNLRQSHGTVNIVLANQDGLVAVTDRMLTTGNEHEPVGHKLFKVDYKTICTMAGLYRNREIFRDIALVVPNLMADYLRQEQEETHLRLKYLLFDDKFRSLIELFQYELTGSLQAYRAIHPNAKLVRSDWEIVLTLAGYDGDGQIKIAQATLTPEETSTGIQFSPSLNLLHRYTPPCELTADVERTPSYGDHLPAPRIIKKDLYCLVAGLTDVAEQRLKNPSQYPNLPALQKYAIAQQRQRPLSVEEMKELALELESETAKDESVRRRYWVGGDPEIAVLRNGAIVSVPVQTGIDLDVGGALLKTIHVSGWHTTCSIRGDWTQGITASTYKSFLQVQGSFTNCGQGLDGILFHNTHFSDSALYYFGFGPLLFPSTNDVDNSTLSLGPTVDLNRPDVHHLVCDFPWQMVIQNNETPNYTCNTK